MATMAAMVTMGAAPSQPIEREHDHDVRRAVAVKDDVARDRRDRRTQPVPALLAVDLRLAVLGGQHGARVAPPSGLQPPTDPRRAAAQPGVDGVPTSTPVPVATRASPAANVLVKGGVPVALEQQGRELTVPGVVTAGKYRILATFDGALAPAGNVTVPATGRVTITCDASTLMCASATEP